MLKHCKTLFAFNLFISIFFIHAQQAFADKAPASGKLEFKLVDESVPAEKLNQLVIAAIDKNKIQEPYGAKGRRLIHQALKDKIPTQTQVYFELLNSTEKTKNATPYLLRDKVELSGEMLSKVEYSAEDYSEPFVTLSFNQEGRRVFADLTAKNIGKKVAILVDDVIITAPMIQASIPDGIAKITFGSNSSSKDAKSLSDILQRNYRLKENK